MEGRDSPLERTAICTAQIIANTTPILSPLVVGGLIIGFEVGEAAAGKLVTVELFTVGLVSIVLAPFTNRIPNHWLAVFGALVLISASAVSARLAGFNDLYLWRGIAGLGGGCLLAIVNAAIAQSRSPVYLYGLAWAAVYAATSALAILVTTYNDKVTAAIMYTWIAGALLPLLPIVWFVPRIGGGRSSAASFPFNTVKTGCLLMLGIMVLAIGMMTYYAFLERMAVNIGASTAQTGRIVAVAQAAGIMGGLLAAPVTNWIGLKKSLIAVTFLHAGVIVFAIYTDRVLLLTLAAFFEALLFIMLTPMMFALAALVDKHGRWAASAGGVFVLSTAFGSTIGGELIEGFGYSAIALLQIISAIIAATIFAYVLRKMS